jgi:Zn-dependent M28 family amino/carboxypeptidase
MVQHGLLPAGDKRMGITNWFQDVQNDSLVIRNVLGMIKGVDTTKCIVVSAHYDHLGVRNDSIFAGADDNASGVSGMLALANRWNKREQRPPCNLIFAAWSAEEKGMLGSKYFVQNFPTGKESFLLNMNFDMISRSDPQDATCNILEIGILKGRDDYKELALSHNRSSGSNFDLGFWETDGNGGSDYISFSAHGIPVMAFFAGLNGDYHSPADTRDKIDWEKMIRVLKLANSCLESLLYAL